MLTAAKLANGASKLDNGASATDVDAAVEIRLLMEGVDPEGEDFLVGGEWSGMEIRMCGVGVEM